VRCPKCGNYRFDPDDNCLNCGHVLKVQLPPNGTPSSVNPFDLAEALREKRRRDSIPALSECFSCHESKLAYDKSNDIFCCYNQRCVLFNVGILSTSENYLKIIEFINIQLEASGETGGKNQSEFPVNKKDIFQGIMWPVIAESHEIEEPKYTFSNPSLLSVKMLLGEKRSWSKEYREREYVCSDFAQDVIDFMTSQEIRCGFTTIKFDNGEGHAIVALRLIMG